MHDGGCAGGNKLAAVGAHGGLVAAVIVIGNLYAVDLDPVSDSVAAKIA